MALKALLKLGSLDWYQLGGFLTMSLKALVRLAAAETVMSALERLWGNSDWRASYIATLKNAQVAGFWQSLGFFVTAEDGDETSLTVAASRRVRYTKDLVEISFAEEQLWKNESGK